MQTDYIGKIRNYYGGLSIKEENNKYYWAIENYNGFEWKEIPGYLYKALLRFEKKYQNDKNKIHTI